MSRRNWKVAAWVSFWIGVVLAVSAALAYPGPDSGRLALLMLVAAVVAVTMAWNAVQ